MSFKIDAILADNSYFMNIRFIEVEKGIAFKLKTDIEVLWHSDNIENKITPDTETAKECYVIAFESGLITVKAGHYLKKIVQIVVTEAKLTA